MMNCLFFLDVCVWPQQYRPAEKAVVNLFSNAVKKILNSIARSAAATNSGQIAMAGGTSLLVLLLQLLSVKRARGRTLRILELLVYFVSLLVFGGAASAGFIKFAASMWYVFSISYIPKQLP